MQQDPTPDAPPAPSPPARAGTSPAPAGQLTGVPATVQELWGLRERQSELGSQLSSVASRRRSLVQQLEEADNPIVSAGLQERIAALDRRILQLESDLAAAGRQLTATPAAILGSTEARPPSDDVADVLAVVGGTILMVVAAVLVVRFVSRIRRRRRPARPALAESAERLERMEQALDAVAIEVERISEGQRFVTRLLSEGSRMPSLASSKKEPEPARTPER